MDIPIRVGISPTLNIRGLIAARDIKKNEILERCPIILVDHHTDTAFKNTILNRYCFEWTKTHSALVLGYGSLYNHSYTPNVRYHFVYTTKEIFFRALRFINMGEELFVNYNGDPPDQSAVAEFYLDGKH